MDTLNNCNRYKLNNNINIFPDVCCIHHFEYNGNKKNLKVASFATVIKPCLGLAFVNEEPYNYK